MRLIGALIGLALLSACGGADDGAEPAAPLVSVGMGEVRRDTITAALTLVGRLGPVPGGSVVLSAPSDALVTSLEVAIGERVRAGQLLVRLDAPEAAARAAALRAEATAADLDAGRQRRLLEEGIASRRQVEERTAAAAAAAAAATAAETLLERTRVTSPIAGLIQRVSVQPGERVTSGQPLVEVIDDSRLDLIATVPLADLALLRVGQPALVDGGGDTRPRDGRVVGIAPAVDSLANAGQVLIRIERPGPSLRAGQSATASVVVGLRRGVLVVPDSALVVVGRQMQVFVVGADSIARARPVEVGVRAGGRAEVTGALSPGDRVVTTGAFGLVDGGRVVAARPDST